jgi:hypothetical protein
MNNLRCTFCQAGKKANFTHSSGMLCKNCLQWYIKRGLQDKLTDLKAIPTTRRYNLPLDHRYNLIDTTCMGLDNYTSCDNCNRVINNVATLQDENGKKYDVGLDCATTLSLNDTTDIFKLLEQEAKFKKITKLQSDIKKWKVEGKYSVVVEGNDVTLYNAANITEWSSFWKVRMSLDRYNQYYAKYK